MTTTQIIAKQGWIGTGVLLALFLISTLFDWTLCGFVSLVCLILWVAMFRNPERIPQTHENNAFVSPVDGIVRDIYSTNNEVHIKIETSFLDVGVIRAPCDVFEGKISQKKGLSLTCCNKQKQAQLNATMRFENKQDCVFSMEFFPIFFSSHELFAYSHLELGERIGFMKAGMTQITIPQDSKNSFNEIELKVSIGDRVSASQSVLGYFYEV